MDFAESFFLTTNFILLFHLTHNYQSYFFYMVLSIKI